MITEVKGLLSGYINSMLLVNTSLTDLEKDNIRGSVKGIAMIETEKSTNSLDTLEMNLGLGQKPLWWLYYYNKEGFITKFERKYSDGGIAIRSEYKYNNLGQLISQTDYEDEDVSNEIVYQYDAKGNLIKEENLIIDEQCIATYNEFGQIIELIKQSYLGNYKYQYEYNEAGLQSKTFEIVDNTILSMSLFSYDSKKQLIDESIYDDSTLVSQRTIEYDDKGNIVKQKTKKNNSKSIYELKFEYKYDEYNNWIESKYYQNNTLRCVTNRKLMY